MNRREMINNILSFLIDLENKARDANQSTCGDIIDDCEQIIRKCEEVIHTCHLEIEFLDSR